MKRIIIVPFLCVFLSGCLGGSIPALNQSFLQKDSPKITHTAQPHIFDNIPELDGTPIPIAVYSFIDKTGQRKPSQTVSSFSTAVTQGADAYVVKALYEAGNGKWFKPVERVGLDDLVKERQLIRQMREQEQGDKAQALPPLLVAGVLLEGAIIDYNSSIKTGGNGARYLGIGPNTQYIQDQVTINMRLVSVQTGEVLTSVSVEKNLLSTSEGISAFTFFNQGTNAFEIDSQQTKNEPENYAIRSAIETGVVELIKSGEKRGLWHYKTTQEKHK